MAKFKVGDRVRINCPKSNAHGDTGTIWMIDTDNDWRPEEGVARDVIGYCIDIDGHGKFRKSSSYAGDYIAFEAHELEPLVPPDELAWQQFKTYLQPNPAILPPIVTTSDEEAARIAETTPGSHIHVVSRSGNVLSEYWGKPF